MDLGLVDSILQVCSSDILNERESNQLFHDLECLDYFLVFIPIYLHHNNQ
jgi:hypothetical protein